MRSECPAFSDSHLTGLREQLVLHSAQAAAGVQSVVPTRGETLQQLRRMLLFRRLPARRPEALGRTVGRRTLADDGSGAGLEGRHTGKYRRAYEFMVSPRQPAAANPLVPSAPGRTAPVWRRLRICALRVRALWIHTTIMLSC